MSEYLESAEFIHDFLVKDRRAFKALYLSYYGKLRSFSLAITCDEMAAENIATNCILRLLDETDRFSNGPVTFKNIKVFLFVMVRNESRNYYNSVEGRARRGTSELRHDPEIQFNIEHAIVKAEVSASVYAALKKLPVERCRVLELLYCEGRSYKETARILNISLEAVKSHRRAGASQVRLILKKESLISTVAYTALILTRCYLALSK